jgi:F-type H+-transporting ATPase subunit gamma
MASLKEIDNRLKSVRNTKKTTYAMKLVSAAKLRKAQEAAHGARDYTDALVQLGDRLLDALPADEKNHPLMEIRPTKKTVRIIAAGGNRGLCGSYNGALNKALEAQIRKIKAAIPGVSIEVTALGKKVAEYCKRQGIRTIGSFENLPEDATKWPIDEICKSFEADFLSGAVDEVVMVYTKFKSAMSMSPTSRSILPLAPIADKEFDAEIALGVRLFEPSVEAVWSALIPQILRGEILQASLDAKAAEHGSRMTAMDSATKNAGQLITALQRTYNRVRQGNITAQLLDIIGGAEALK